ncbi:polyhydroxybutyrate depolymerase [Parafrankia irregularis]|uniref:Polyhydroxybutyrate depolymerase n=1 Tax=Parafrankia irregularis TaxID=795642 RepID=A0A0S4QVH4_9ACTN|nr:MULTISPECIES: PHB depolymerase family esterase [Parafrankia]MBE3203673.1 prolyl oligopeptidase family serine peptidase [Parafrankia sp. CH37]CUU59086.1 polyhydroxybutyrate depolymerase [Parafrankia irregularis]
MPTGNAARCPGHSTRERRLRLGSAAVRGFAALLLVASCGPGDDTARSIPVAAPGAAPGACAPARPAPAAGQQIFRVGDTDRSYLLGLPAGYDGQMAYPLLFSFHGFGGSMEEQEANTSLAQTGTARGYIVVTPQSAGSPPKWNFLAQQGGADDFGFIQALLGDLTTRLCIDPDRVYAAGHSNGSAFAGFLVCKPPYPFAAVAMVAGVAPPSCPDGTAPATLAVNGTADVTVPYQNSAASIATYVERYRCATAPGRTRVADGVEQMRYQGCVQGSEIVFITVAGGTHVWPGGPAAAGDRPSARGNSQAGRTFPATDTVLDFFDQHHLSVHE